MSKINLETERLILREFTENDLDAVYRIFSDEEVNRFLPWFPVKTPEEAELFYRTHLDPEHREKNIYRCAVCMKKDNIPIGYITVGAADSYDFGYGLRKEFWHSGIITEGAMAVINRLKQDGIPYITATHDVNNPRSGSVMKRLGMKYMYSYEEQWQPKDISVIFRMYQLNFDGQKDRIYKKYWDHSENHFVEEIT